MSALVEVIGGVAHWLGMGPLDMGDREVEAAVLVEGEWEEGTLHVGDTRMVWEHRVVFSPAGVVERIEEWSEDPELVVLHYRRGDLRVQLAIHPRELERVAKVLTLP